MQRFITRSSAIAPHLRVRIVERWQAGGYIDLLTAHLEARSVRVVGPTEFFCAFDILHLHAPHFLRGVRFWLTALQVYDRHPVFWTAHDIPEDTVGWRYEWTTRALAKRADVILCHGNPSRQLLIDRFGAPPSRIHVMPHPSFVGLFPGGVTRAEARRVLGLPPDAFVFLLLGNIRRGKGARRFLRALDCLGDRQSLFVVAGSPEFDREEVAFLEQESLRRSQLRLHLGAVPGDRLQIFFGAADVAVFPYEHITTSGAVHLAMSFGVPVLGANINCLGADIHTDGGIKYPTNEVEDLESAIVKMQTTSQSEREAMGARNLERMAAWTFADFAAATEHLYESLAG